MPQNHKQVFARYFVSPCTSSSGPYIHTCPLLTHRKVYDGSIRAPHSPAKWGGAPAEVERANALAKRLEIEFSAKVAAARKTSAVVIHYCGGCGFAARARELQGYLVRTTGVSAALLQDRGTTGRFTVRMRAAAGATAVLTKAFESKYPKGDYGMRLVHSKADGSS